MTDDGDSIGPDDELEEEELEEESIIPEEDFREAIAACRRDPELNRYFELAPPGAKLFIGLGFYSTHFGDKVDPLQYAECQAEIEPALAPNDLKYLIRFERDKNTKQYLRNLLAKREAEETEPPAEQSDAMPALPKRKRRKKPTKPDLQAQAESDEPHAGMPLPFKMAALFALLLGGALLLYLAARPSNAPQPERWQLVEALPDAPEKDKAPAHAAKRPEAKPVRATLTDAPSEGTYALVDADEEDAIRHGADMRADIVDAPVATTAEPSNQMVAATANDKRRTTRKPRVILTDGKKIVRRPGGQIEVPRAFSCAGAGIKPFWVYGAHPEADAAKEKKAREEWQALVQQARQAEEEARQDGS